MEISEIGFYSPPSRSDGSKLSDLGYIKVQSSSSLPGADIRSLGKSFHFNDRGNLNLKQKHYVLGYPYLGNRPSLAEEQIVTLRLSEGFQLKGMPVTKSGTLIFETPPKATNFFLLYSDADTIEGNSGGPVIAEDGQLLGVLIGGPSAREYTKHECYSYVVPIDFVRRMVGDILLRRMKNVVRF